MTPFDLAAQFQAADPDNIGLHEAIAAHLFSGVVISTPTVFLLIRPVDTRSNHLLFDDPWVTFQDPDCWHCYLAAGDLSQFGRYIPSPLPLVSYVRKNSLRIHPLAQTPFGHGWKTETRTGSVSG
jgi:hypothetical protein